jgi:hypothetical protein
MTALVAPENCHDEASSDVVGGERYGESMRLTRSALLYQAGHRSKIDHRLSPSSCFLEKFEFQFKSIQKKSCPIDTQVIFRGQIVLVQRRQLPETLVSSVTPVFTHLF